MLSSQNDYETALFRLADVAHQARAIINICVEGHDISYGGIVGIGAVPSFYVSVAGSASSWDLASSGTINPLLGNSTTIQDTEPGGKTTFSDTE